MKLALKRVATRKILFVASAGVVLYALAGFFLSPYLLERYALRYAQDQLGSQATVGSIRVNPFLLSLEARDFRLEYPPGRPIIAVGRLLVDFQLSSLFRRAWTFADVQVDGLDLSVEVRHDGTLNLAALRDRLAKRYADVSSGDQPPRRWLLQHAVLRAGKVTFVDLSGPTPAGTTFAPINLELLDLTSLPDRHGRYTITAALPDGGSIAWRGDVTVLPMASAGELEAKGLKVATAWAFLRPDLRVSPPTGSVDLAAGYRFAYGDGKAALALERIRASVSALTLRKSGSDEPLLVLDTIIAKEGRFDLGHGDSPMRFEAALTTAHGGSVKASGTIARDLASADAQVEAVSVALAPLQPLIAHYAALDLKSGHASASARVAYRGGSAGPSLRATGAVTMENVLVNETETGDRFVSWKTLAADEVVFSLAPNRLAVKEIRLLEPGAKILISRDREVNLAQVLKSPANGPRASESSGDGFAADINRIRVRNGTVDFADLSLALPFSARVRRFNGTAVGISTDRASRAELKFDGRIEGSGAAKVEGGLNAFAPKSFTDIRVEFDNVEMPPLSPYAATFAGRKIAAGRVWLDLRYKIVNSELAGENKIVMQDFTLGERVEAPNALDLPLDLAVALLTDSEGRINVAVPVRGNVDNPQFSYRHLIREALANLIVRVVSAPFRALARLTGSDSETLGSINFEPGRARLLPPEREKLDKVVKTLQEKPQVKLVVRGPYDPTLDGEALRERQVRREVAQALGVRLDPREDPGPIAYSDAATQRALEGLLTRRAGPKAAQELEGEFRNSAGRDPERANRVLALFGKASPDREFYQAMFRRLLALEPLPEAEVHRLAQRRAEAIMQYLVQSAGADPGRVAIGEIRAAEDASDEAVVAELSLALMTGAS